MSFQSRTRQKKMPFALLLLLALLSSAAAASAGASTWPPVPTGPVPGAPCAYLCAQNHAVHGLDPRQCTEICTEGNPRQIASRCGSDSVACGTAVVIRRAWANPDPSVKACTDACVLEFAAKPAGAARANSLTACRAGCRTPRSLDYMACDRQVNHKYLDRSFKHDDYDVRDGPGFSFGCFYRRVQRYRVGDFVPVPRSMTSDECQSYCQHYFSQDNMETHCIEGCMRQKAKADGPTPYLGTLQRCMIFHSAIVWPKDVYVMNGCTQGMAFGLVRSGAVALDGLCAFLYPPRDDTFLTEEQNEIHAGLNKACLAGLASSKQAQSTADCSQLNPDDASVSNLWNLFGDGFRRATALMACHIGLEQARK